MKKIIAAIDGLKYSEGTARYAIEMARENEAHLVAVFLEDVTYHSYKIYELVEQQGVSIEKKAWLENKDKETREESVERFRSACRDAGVNFSVHRDRSIAIQELLHESIYADLLVVDARETLTHYQENKPTRFIRDLLSQVQCPVLIVPEEYKPVQKNILLYDGAPSSVAAIRAFSYLLPSLKKLPTEVLSVKSEKQTLHVPDNRLMKEFMKRHFPDAVYTVAKGNADTEILKYLQTQEKNILVVLGAYSRGMISRWFKASMADVLMHKLDLPLFIAHYK